MSESVHSEDASWNGLAVGVTARLIPRNAWQTASIDLTIGDQVVMKTRGVFKFVGQIVRKFDIQGTEHEAALHWGRGTLTSFPYEVTLDGSSVRRCLVR